MVRPIIINRELIDGRTIWKGQDMANGRETRKVGFLCGNRIAVFDSYLYNLNSGDSAAAVSAAVGRVEEALGVRVFERTSLIGRCDD